MDTPGQPTPAPRSGKPLAIAAIIVVVLFLGSGLYFWLSGGLSGMTDDDETEANVNATTNQATPEPVNLNSTTNTTETTNTVANANQAVTNAETTPVVASERTITYQRADHGFQFVIPGDWSATQYGSGFTERDTLVYANTPSSADPSVSFRVNFFNNVDSTLEQWTTAHAPELRGDSQTAGTRVIAGQTAISYDMVTNGAEFESRQSNYYYLQRDGHVYELNIEGQQSALTIYRDELNAVLNSFTFVDPKPIIVVAGPSTLTKVSPSGNTTQTVEWLAAPESINIEEPLVTEDEFQSVIGRQYYKMATVTAGSYAGKDLVIVLERPGGPSFGDTLYRVIYDATSKTFVYLEKHSADLQYLQKPISYDTSATVTGLEMPETIAIPGSTTSLKAELYNQNQLFSDLTDLEKEFDDATVGPVFYSASHKCLVVETPDHLVKRYYYQLPFAKNFVDREFVSSASLFVPDVTWSDGLTATGEYTFNEPNGGCGSSACNAIYTTRDLGGENVLKAAGTTSNGDTVYEYANPDHAVLQETYDAYLVPEPQNKKTFEQYKAAHPLFYWKDPFGRWVRFKSNEYMPAVECGKPVIYLYPTSPTKVNVQVAPTGGFTYTDPIYPAGGWTVQAQPSGQLTMLDGQAYPYLFWEGYGMNYQQPEAGFMVKRADVPAFLTKTLAQLGLNETESRDFMDFWVPRMTEKPWYFVTFVDQPTFDQLAPLTVTPKPQTVIRVFMDYQGLDEAHSVKPLDIVTPQRKGFTVVEWGGALHR